MSGGRPLAIPSQIVYQYDGGLAGFYTCVHESVYLRQLPLAIAGPDAPLSLLAARFVETDPVKAQKVRDAVKARISLRARELVETVFLSCLPEKELHLLRFLLRAFREGPSLLLQLGDPEMTVLLKAERHLGGEAHLFKGFVRFSDVDGKLISTIRPKNFILPFLAEHFMLRFPQENFMIVDLTHSAALLYEHGRMRMLQVDGFEMPEVGEEELRYREMWVRFFDTLAIEERENPICQRTHVPKRYWSEMVELRGKL